MRPVFQGDVPHETLFAALDVLPDLLHVEPQGLNLLHLNYTDLNRNHLITSDTIIIMRYLYLLFLIGALVLGTSALPDPVYTIHYVRSYRNDLIPNNFGCQKSVVYGVYLYPLGPVDALYALMNSQIYGFSSGCQRKLTYIKLFGDAQDYSKLMDINESIISQIIQSLTRGGARAVIINWKHFPEGALLEKSRKALEDITKSLKNAGYNVTIKAPASYFCKVVNGKRFILDQPTDEFIMELYGEEQGQYVTYESIFGKSVSSYDGYSTECPKYPTRPVLNEIAAGRKVYF